MKKTITGIMSALLIVSMLAGCTSPSTQSPSSASSSASSGESVSSVTATDGTPSWKQDTSPVTMEWFVGYDWASQTFDPVNNTLDKRQLEETGVTLKYSYGDLQKLNMLITTNSLPDIVTYDVASTERLTMENNGLLYPLDDLREEYAPDFRVVPAMIEWYRNDKDQKWYAFSSFFYDLKDTEARGCALDSHNMNYVRRDIMEQLGIKDEDMHTQDGFIAALKKVKDAKIQYNGITVEPFVGADVTFLAEQFGADREDKEGNLINIMRAPEYQEAILFLNRIYREGLITDEEFTMDKTLRDQKVSTGGIFAGVGKPNVAREPLYQKDNNALMGGVGLIAGKEGKSPIVSPAATGGWTGTMISKNCKTPDRAIRLFAFLAQEEIAIASTYGGLDGYDIIDGAAIIKPERLSEQSADPAAYNAKYKTGSMDYFCDYVDIKKVAPTKNLNTFQADDIAYQEKYHNGHFYDDKIFTNVSPDGGTELAALAAQITEYWKQQNPQIIMAKSADEAIAMFNQTMKQLDDMGMQKLDDFKNERFHKNKEKMGLKFAWPRNQ